ncbi:MAG: pyridoxamine 5'-phosphate oxidase family protein [Deltaproteobacteria bacterium]|jgi:hypothetical protein|nr:pyridoxamine 5'-phosphate oxidase family protein [Deltaproteobacteria bacterium]MBW2530436.1 pyridoxamine 5'-phosphate oxidase family protein [Deltaproteobacteria bacterium]
MGHTATDQTDRTANEAVHRLRRLLDSQRFAVLATQQQGGHPYTSLLAFTVADDLATLTFCTLRTTRKFANLEAEPRVSLLIDDRDNAETDLQDAAAVTVLGEAEELTGDAREREVDRFLGRHPAMADFIRSPGCALMRVAVRAYYLVTRFQNVIELYPADGTFRTADPEPG